MKLLKRSARPKPSVVVAERILGVDPSLSSTGYAYRDERGVVFTGRIESGTLRGPWRLHYVLVEMAKVVESVRPTRVIYEDYAMGKTMGRIFDIGELGGILKHMLWTRGITIDLISPTALKKFVTGRGNPGFTGKGQKKLNDRQKKQLIIDALQADFGLSIPQNDEADAAGLLLMGEAKAGQIRIPSGPLQSKRAQALAEFATIRGQLKSISRR